VKKKVNIWWSLFCEGLGSLLISASLWIRRKRTVIIYRPPPGGVTKEDLDRLSNLPDGHVEWINDGIAGIRDMNGGVIHNSNLNQYGDYDLFRKAVEMAKLLESRKVSKDD